MHAHTLEVVATFGDGVVAVRHVTAERRSALTAALIAAGALLVAVALAGFLWATHRASVNDTARDRWLDRGHPPWAFRPAPLPPDLDAIFVGGGLLGLAALTAGLARRRARPRSDDGIALTRDGLALRLPTGDFVPVNEQTRLSVTSGSVVFHIATVSAPPALEPAPVGDRRTAAFIAASALAHIGLLFLLRPPAPAPTARAEPVPVRPATLAPDEPVAEEGGGSGGGTTHAAATPTAGAVIALPESNAPPGAALVDPRGAGILGSDKLAAIAAITGTADVAAGLDAIDALDADLTAIGDFGTSLTGFVESVPGGSISLGRISMLTETVVPYDRGPQCGCISLPPRRVSRVHLGDPEGCVGDCDKSRLRRAMRRSLAKLEYCYEKQLLDEPNLHGTVVTRFVLTPDGGVREVAASGVDATVASCVHEVVAAVDFPRFQTVLAITYPITFSRVRD